MPGRKLVFSAVIVIFLVTACKPAGVAAPPRNPTGASTLPIESQPETISNPTLETDSSPEVNRPGKAASQANPPAPTEASKEQHPTAQSAPAASIGPDAFPQGVSTLTGQAVKDPSRLAYPPALISVTNFPISARPQAGLSYSPYVFELYIGEGMTRFLAMFYGDYPDPPETSSGNMTVATDRASIGPIRSGRLPYGSLSKLYNGFLVMASASAQVKSQLGGATTIFGSDADNINSALIDVTQLDKIAQASSQGKKFNLTGNRFTAAAPQGGKRAAKAWIFYSWLNQVLWNYDPTSGAYLRSQDNADGSGKFIPSSDRLNGKPLAFNNVIVLFSQHHVQNRAGTLIDVDLLYTSNYAYLFRDGQVFRLRWSTENGNYEKSTGLMRPIRFVDDQGNPFPLKPGSTWVEIVHSTTTIQELEPGSWKVRFYAPTR